MSDVFKKLSAVNVNTNKELKGKFDYLPWTDAWTILMEHYPEDNPIKRVFEGEDKQKNVARAIEMIRNSSIPQECYQIASEYRDKACHSLSSLPENSIRQSLVKLADYVVSRKN